MFGQRIDLPRVANFAVEIEGMLAAGFSKVSSPSETLGFYQVPQELNRRIKKQIPIDVTTGNITLSTGFGVTNFLKTWWEATRDWKKGDGDIRKNVHVIKLLVPFASDLVSIEIDRIIYLDCYPVRYGEANDYDAMSEDGLVFEEVELHTDYPIRRPYNMTEKMTGLKNKINDLVNIQIRR